MSGSSRTVVGPPVGRTEIPVGTELGKYRIEGVLGAGGMGMVYRAHDASIGRDIALKILAPALADDAVALGRFLAEARAAGKLNHPNVVAIYDIGESDGINYIAMELVEGGSVSDRLESDGLYPVAEATRIIADACKGLSAAHAKGLIHRDIKPANLIFAEDRTVKVADFGLATGALGVTQKFTQDGHVIGTPNFMSPEQCESRPLDHRSDIYSLGATFYSLLTGMIPYHDSGSVAQVMYAHVHGDVLDPSTVNSMVPPACAAIVRRATAKEPAQRYTSADEMLVDLEAVLGSMSGASIELPSESETKVDPVTPVRSFPMRPVLIVFGLVVVVAGLLFSEPWKSEERDDVPAGAPTGPPIKVGVLHSMSGTMASSESAVVDATLLAIAEINDGGGVLGRPVEPIVADGRSDSSTFAREARRLIAEEGVATVFGCWTSASRKTVVPVFEELDNLLIYPLQYEGVEESPNVVYTGAAPNQQIMPAVAWAHESLGAKRFFLVGSDYIFPRTANAIVRDQVAALGALVVGEEYRVLGDRDWKAVVDEIVTSKPDVILSTINGDSNFAFFSQLRRSGVTTDAIPTISFSIGEEELRHLDAADVVGSFAAWNYFQSIDSPENREFVAAFQARYGPQRVVTDPMESAYFGVKLWARAVQDSGSAEAAAIRRAMRNQRFRAPGGDVRIDPATQHTLKTPRIGRIRADGGFDIVFEAAEPVMPTPYPPSRTTEQWKAFLHDLYRGWDDSWAAPAESSDRK